MASSGIVKKGLRFNVESSSIIAIPLIIELPFKFKKSIDKLLKYTIIKDNVEL